MKTSSFLIGGLCALAASAHSQTPGPTDLVEADARVIRTFDGEDNDQLGYEAANAGDVDGDGVTDIVVGAPAWSNRAGRFYIWSGKDGSLLFEGRGEQPGAQLGWTVAGVGDVDGDGKSDVAVGEPGWRGEGRVRVFHGDGRMLHEWDGEQQNEFFGDEVETAGDWDGDGHADVVVGAPRHDASRGRVYVFSGKSGRPIFTLDGPAPGERFGSAVAGFSNGKQRLLVVGAPRAGDQERGRVYVYRNARDLAFTIEPEETAADLGSHFVSIPGDCDGDGIPDVYASDWKDKANGSVSGRIYVHSGKDGSRIFTRTGERPNDGFGIGNARAGDVDGDGLADLVVGSWIASAVAPRAGKVTLLRGTDGAVLRTWTCTEESMTFGYDSTGLGDVDGDGYADFLVAGADANGGRGRVWVLAGSKVSASAFGPELSQAEVITELAAARKLIRENEYGRAAELLEGLVARAPQSGQAWYLFGYSLQAAGELDRAAEAHAKAAEFPEVRAGGAYNAACVWALKGDADRAFEWLDRAVEAGFDDKQLLLTDADLASLRGDDRFAAYLEPRDKPPEDPPHDAEDPEHPFVEQVRILQSWSGEGAGDQFGWEATRLGDLDGDGKTDFLLTAAYEADKAGRVLLVAGK